MMAWDGTVGDKAAVEPPCPWSDLQLPVIVVDVAYGLDPSARIPGSLTLAIMWPTRV
jgi:hypothetical protein